MRSVAFMSIFTSYDKDGWLNDCAEKIRFNSKANCFRPDRSWIISVVNANCESHPNKLPKLTVSAGEVVCHHELEYKVS